MTAAPTPYSASHECQHTGKRAHPTRALARAHRDDLARHDPAGDRLDVYRCGAHWHVGHRDTTAFDRRLRRALGGPL